MSGRTLTVRDLCERYGVTEHTVLGWIRGGELRALSVSRKAGSKKPRWRVTPEALASWELLRTHTPPPPRTRRRKHDDETIQYY